MKKIVIAAAAALIILGTGCSTIQNVTNSVQKKFQSTKNVVRGDKAEAITPPKDEAEQLAQEMDQDYTTVLPQTDVPAAVTPATPVYTPSLDSAKTVVAPESVPVKKKTPAENNATKKKVQSEKDKTKGKEVEPDAASSLTLNSKLAKQLDGEWQIIQVGSHTIDRDEDMPYIVFEPTAGSFYGNNGCNTLNGAYSTDGNGNITFHNVLSTMRLCQDTKFDSEINAIVADNVTSHLKLTEVGKETFLDFVNDRGKILMRLRRGNLGFLNGNWQVESIAGIEKMEVPADIFFDLGELKLHGNTGCNFINGTIYLDHRRSNAVDFSNMITTRMACPYNDQQTAMLVALEQTETAISDGADHVMFLDGRGRNLMTLRRIPTNASAD